ncbi:helix-turn-helix domain-containing protein [Algoriphagus sp. H41]|uniref:Helix-turn-helix domain-containing protein n=1 Tax=Algoriphagus oliviformis TaxID=2811231 RepID=A0ABS3BZM0_9BACT|nr:AraC family transcriptional regulator [Algoriphagus oliviformis]MBN7809326.1 helix-turn-helix domain-containing protein [Algoriphagus oliviformis]
MAKIISFQIPKSQSEFVRYQEDRGRHFYDKLHQHPQLQLTVIREGAGQFLSGDYLGRFQAGDVFFLGENAPHVFRSDPEYFATERELKSTGDTVFFDFQAFGKALGELEELESLRKFGDFAGLCFQVLGEGKRQVVEIFDRFPKSSGLGRFQLALELLAILDQAGEELQPLNRPALIRGLSERDGKRMDQVMQFVFEESARAITLQEVADRANLGKEAFCRFFKLHTRKTFTQYLQQVRISQAKKLLLESDLGVAEIAFQVGFENLSYFNRSFKSLTGLSPLAWRKSERTGA